MLDAKELVELETLRDQVSVKFVEALIEQSGEVFGQLVRLLQTAAQAISQGRDVRNVVVLLENVFLRLVLESSLQVAFVIEHPAEDALLDLLVVFLFEKVIMNELHAAHHEQLAALQTHVEGANRSVCGEADRAGAEERARGLADIQSRAVRVDELKTAILVAVVCFVLGVAVLAGIFAGLFVIILFLAAASPKIVMLLCYLLDELVRKAAISDERFLRVQVLVESLADDAVGVDRNTNLLEHCVDVGVQFVLAAFSHRDDNATAIFDVAADILQFLRGERQSGASEKEHVRLLQSLEVQLGLVDFALVAVLKLANKFLIALGGIQHLFLRRIE